MNNYYKTLRVKHWRAYILLSIFAFLLAEGYLQTVLDSIIYFLMVFFYLGFSFSINNCFDVVEDKIQKKKTNPVATGDISFKHAVSFSSSLAIFGIIFSIYFNNATTFFYIILIALALVYSATPIRLKSRFILDLISHGFFGGVMILLLPFVAFNMQILFSHYILAGAIFCLSLIYELRNHINDYEADKKANLRTTVCVLGKKSSQKLTKALVFIFPLFFIYLVWFEKYFWIFLVITLLFYSIFFTAKKQYLVFDMYTNVLLALYLLEMVV